MVGNKDLSMPFIILSACQSVHASLSPNVTLSSIILFVARLLQMSTFGGALCLNKDVYISACLKIKITPIVVLVGLLFAHCFFEEFVQVFEMKLA